MTTPSRTHPPGEPRSRGIDVLLGMLLRATGLALWVASAIATLGFLVEFVPIERTSGRPDGLVGLAAVALGVAARFCTVQGRRLRKRARPMIGEPGAPTDTRRLDALSPDDLARHPVWAAVDSCYPDGGVAVRPLTGADDARAPGRLFARATFVLADGRAVSGYLVPPGSDESLEALRPVMTTRHGQVPLCHDDRAPGPDELRELYRRLDARDASEVFPVQYRFDRTAGDPPLTGALDGFIVFEGRFSGSSSIVS